MNAATHLMEEGLKIVRQISTIGEVTDDETAIDLSLTAFSLATALKEAAAKVRSRLPSSPAGQVYYGVIGAMRLKHPRMSVHVTQLMHAVERGEVSMVEFFQHFRVSNIVPNAHHLAELPPHLQRYVSVSEICPAEFYEQD